jgi:hypothetical protein
MTMPPSTAPRQLPPERIRSPLHQLRGTIRRYVLLEGAALFVLMVAFFFWAGLVLDYGAFKIVGVDWVQVLPAGARVAVLAFFGVALVVMLAVTIFRRLLGDFSYPSLALVLERRFPDLLGDRLITAVELTDMDEAASFGYSTAMIQETVREATERVKRMPVADAFNWGRLRFRWAMAIMLAIVPLPMVATGYMAGYRAGPIEFATRFVDVGTIWAERNLLFMGTLWPRRTYLRLVDFPESGELRIGRDAPSPRLRVQAIKWAIADRSASDGWRAMTWSDLTPELLNGRQPPSLPVEALANPSNGMVTQPPTDPAWTIDRIESLLIDNAEIRKRVMNAVDGDTFLALEQVFESLENAAQQSRMSRRIRKLIIPTDIRVSYWGPKTSNLMPFPRQADSNEFAGVLTELKESVRFSVQAEDFTLYPPRRITLVPPPSLARLERDEFVPAYFYLRPPADGGPESLKGKKLQRLGQGVSLTGGTSRIDVSAGTDLVLRGESDKELSMVRFRYRGGTRPGMVEDVETGKLVEELRQEIQKQRPWLDPTTDVTTTVREFRQLIRQRVRDELQRKLNDQPGASTPNEKQLVAEINRVYDTPRLLDEYRRFLYEKRHGAGSADPVETIPIRSSGWTFSKRFDNITRTIEFDLELTDTDHVVSRRHVVIQPIDDRTPEVNAVVDVIRKTPQGYLATHQALIPFSGSIRDDVGLNKIEYQVAYTRLESASTIAARAAVAAGIFGLAPNAPPGPNALALPGFVAQLSKLTESSEPVINVPPLGVRSFEELARERDQDHRYGLVDLPKKLAEAPPLNALIKQFELKPNIEGLDLRDRLPELERSKINVTIQPRYRVRLTVVATDNNVDTGPRQGQNKETFTFQIVTNEEVLAEIAREEEGISQKMRELLDRMHDVRTRIDKVLETMPVAGSEDYRPLASRAAELEEQVAKGRDTAQEILSDYNRILREMTFNRLPDNILRRVKDGICDRLDEAIRAHFPRAEEAHAALRKVFEDRRPPEQLIVENCRQRQQELINQLQAVSDAIGDFGGVLALAKTLADITRVQREVIGRFLQEEIADLQDRILDELGTLTLTAPDVQVAAGQKVTATIKLSRSQLEGRVQLRLTATGDPDLKFPPVVTVPRLQEEVKIEFEAGTKTGTFIIQIKADKPSKEPPLMNLRVIVK